MSPATAGPFFAVAVLLGTAGLAKLLRPVATQRALVEAGLASSPTLARLLGVVELVVAAAAVALGSRPIALVVFATYLAFALVTIRLIARSNGGAGCGCFGRDSAPAGHLHVGLNLAAAGLAALAALVPPGGLRSVIADQPLAGVPFVGSVLLCSWLGYHAFTTLPAAATSRLR